MILTKVETPHCVPAWGSLVSIQSSSTYFSWGDFLCSNTFNNYLYADNPQ